MTFGILEPNVEVVEGTVALYDKKYEQEAGIVERPVSGLKHTKDGKILLNPQPSDSPNDPLNWPLWQRDFRYGLLVVCTVCSGCHGPILGSVTISLAEKMHKSVSDIAQLTSYMLLVIGVAAYFANVAARVWGKRALFIFALATMIAADAWAAAVGDSSYTSLLGARCLSGVGQSVFEGITLAVVPDLYFVHERGIRVAAFVLAVVSGASLGVPLSTAVITHSSLGWAFGALAITEGVCFILMIFIFFEPSFVREHVDILAHQAVEEVESKQMVLEVDLMHIEHVTTYSDLKETTYLQKLNLYHGRFSHHNPLTLLWRTFALTLHPTILWCACCGLSLGWSVGLSYTINISLTTPPYNFSSDAIANIQIATWIGLVLGIVVVSTSDRLCVWLAKRNDTTFEPEFRLWYVPIGTFFGVLGFAGWGWGLQAGVHWIGLAFFMVFMYMGVGITGSAGIAYAIDAHRPLSNESQIVIMAVKNLFPFGMGYWFVSFYTSEGSKNCWGMVAGVVAATNLLGVFFYIFGKRLRAFWMRHPFLGIRDMH